MPRVKGGYTTRRRRKAVLKLAKGYYGSKHLLYRTAHEQVMRSLQYAYRDRKVKKREFRKLWIQRINAACQMNGLKYNQFINGLTKAGVQVNRKMLADLAVTDPKAFTSIVEEAKKGLTIEVKPSTEKVVKLNTESKELKAAAAVEAAKSVKAAKAEKKVAPKAEKPAAPKAEKKVAPKAEKPVEAKVETVDYTKMTVAELKEAAKAKGLTGLSAMKKADLIAALTK